MMKIAKVVTRLRIYLYGYLNRVQSRQTPLSDRRSHCSGTCIHY
jgi:hypothetical protein